MHRRQFIKNTGTVVSVPLFINGTRLSAMAKPWFFGPLTEESDRVLVLIKLGGGNDGLNTVIPLDQYGNLHNVRSNVIIPENKILPVTDTVGFHPALTGLQTLYEEASVGVVQSVGYPNQNRSHFKSMQFWYSGAPDNETESTGWLGRYLDEQYPGFPNGYPNAQHPDPFAISMGNFITETCQGLAANFSMALNDPFALSELAEWGNTDDSTSIYGEELRFLRETITQSNFYFDQIQAATEVGNNLADYPDTELGQQLKNVALMISGGLSTKIYTVSINGFDTHSEQVQEGNPVVGEHASLLANLSQAIHAFQEDLRQLGLEERVIGMTFSEFGRQIRSNASFGTDHGTAAPLLLFGQCVTSQILGENPEIPEYVATQEGVPMQYDFRDVYGSVLMDWFEVPEPDVRNMLYQGFQYLPLVTGCGATTGTEDGVEREVTTEVYPNPFRDRTTIRFSTKNEWVRLSVFDGMGRELEVVTNQRLQAGKHEVRFDGSRLPPGNYYYRLVLEGKQLTKRMVKI